MFLLRNNENYNLIITKYPPLSKLLEKVSSSAHIYKDIIGEYPTLPEQMLLHDKFSIYVSISSVKLKSAVMFSYVTRGIVNKTKYLVIILGARDNFPYFSIKTYYVVCTH